MLICTQCGHISPEEHSEWNSENNGFYQGITCCPECGSESVVVAKRCEHCKEYFDPDTLVVVDLDVEESDGDDYFGVSGETIEVCVDCYEDYYFKEEQL